MDSCDVCAQNSSSLRCVQCGIDCCFICMYKRHRFGSLVKHKFVLLPLNDQPVSDKLLTAGEPCVICELQTCVVKCHVCCIAFCHECALQFHGVGKHGGSPALLSHRTKFEYLEGVSEGDLGQDAQALLSVAPIPRPQHARPLQRPSDLVLSPLNSPRRGKGFSEFPPAVDSPRSVGPHSRPLRRKGSLFGDIYAQSRKRMGGRNAMLPSKNRKDSSDSSAGTVISGLGSASNRFAFQTLAYEDGDARVSDLLNGPVALSHQRMPRSRGPRSKSIGGRHEAKSVDDSSALPLSGRQGHRSGVHRLDTSLPSSKDGALTATARFGGKGFGSWEVERPAQEISKSRSRVGNQSLLQSDEVSVKEMSVSRSIRSKSETVAPTAVGSQLSPANPSSIRVVIDSEVSSEMESKSKDRDTITLDMQRNPYSRVLSIREPSSCKVRQRSNTIGDQVPTDHVNTLQFPLVSYTLERAPVTAIGVGTRGRVRNTQPNAVRKPRGSSAGVSSAFSDGSVLVSLGDLVSLCHQARSRGTQNKSDGGGEKKIMSMTNTGQSDTVDAVDLSDKRFLSLSFQFQKQVIEIVPPPSQKEKQHSYMLLHMALLSDIFVYCDAGKLAQLMCQEGIDPSVLSATGENGRIDIVELLSHGLMSKPVLLVQINYAPCKAAVDDSESVPYAFLLSCIFPTANLCLSMLHIMAHICSVNRSLLSQQVVRAALRAPSQETSSEPSKSESQRYGIGELGMDMAASIGADTILFATSIMKKGRSFGWSKSFLAMSPSSIMMFKRRPFSQESMSYDFNLLTVKCKFSTGEAASFHTRSVASMSNASPSQSREAGLMGVHSFLQMGVPKKAEKKATTLVLTTPNRDFKLKCCSTLIRDYMLYLYCWWQFATVRSQQELTSSSTSESKSVAPPKVGAVPYIDFYRISSSNETVAAPGAVLPGTPAANLARVADASKQIPADVSVNATGDRDRKGPVRGGDDIGTALVVREPGTALSKKLSRGVFQLMKRILISTQPSFVSRSVQNEEEQFTYANSAAVPGGAVTRLLFVPQSAWIQKTMKVQGFAVKMEVFQRIRACLRSLLSVWAAVSGLPSASEMVGDGRRFLPAPTAGDGGESKQCCEGVMSPELRQTYEHGGASLFSQEHSDYMKLQENAFMELSESELQRFERALVQFRVFAEQIQAKLSRHLYYVHSCKEDASIHFETLSDNARAVLAELETGGKKSSSRRSSVMPGAKKKSGWWHRFRSGGHSNSASLTGSGGGAGPGGGSMGAGGNDTSGERTGPDGNPVGYATLEDEGVYEVEVSVSRLMDPPSSNSKPKAKGSSSFTHRMKSIAKAAKRAASNSKRVDTQQYIDLVRSVLCLCLPVEGWVATLDRHVARCDKAWGQKRRQMIRHHLERICYFFYTAVMAVLVKDMKSCLKRYMKYEGRALWV